MAAADSASPPPSPPPLPKNPWRIAPCSNSPAVIGEPPSSWPALSSNPDPVSPPPPTLSSDSSSSPPPEAAPAPPAPAPAPPASPRDHRPQTNRRGRNPRFHNNRAGGGGNNSPRGGNNSFNNRAPGPAPGWRPNWGVGVGGPPQYPGWGFFPGNAVGVGIVPPAEYFMPYAPHYNEMVYPEYTAEAYQAYYGQPGYEVQFAPPVSPGVGGVVSSPVGLGFRGDFPRDLEIEGLKERLIHQIEYYFSEANLLKDSYLRKQMDFQGWVDIHEISCFKRVAGLIDEFKKKNILAEDVDLIKDTLQASNVVEIQGNKMRKRLEWHKWVLQQPPSPNQMATSMKSIKLED